MLYEVITVAANRRVLCAAPAYLDRAGRPRGPADLARHACIVLRQNDDPYGVWRLARGKESETVKVHGPLSTNDGEVALGWARDGHGILMRAEWNVAADLAGGALEEVLPGWSLPPADIHAVYAERLNLSAKVSAFVGFLAEYLKARPGAARVITSYSIHYTKLYENPKKSFGGPRRPQRSEGQPRAEGQQPPRQDAAPQGERNNFV